MELPLAHIDEGSKPLQASLALVGRQRPPRACRPRVRFRSFQSPGRTLAMRADVLLLADIRLHGHVRDSHGRQEALSAIDARREIPVVAPAVPADTAARVEPGHADDTILVD